MKKSFLIFLSVILLLFTACDSWMQDDDFYSDIENDVKVANAASVNAYIRYANSKMGTTEPSGSITKKVDVPFSVSAVTNDDYGFVKWVAYSTSDFPTNQQHTSLVYESAQAYARDFKGKELSSGFVSFTDPTNPITDVNIYAVRDDIFIMPLVAKRPTVVTSVPSNGRTDVVKNSQIRILFSKPIDENSLTDEFGNSNIQVTSGRAVLTESSDDLSALDITHYFDFKLSRTKKMLTISAKKGSDGKAIYKFDNNAQISITLFEDLKDSDGYAMNGSYKFSFTTGTKEDSLAPKIENLTAGIGQNCLDYQQYKYDNTDTNNKYSILAQNAPADATNRLSAYITESNRLEAANKVPLLNQRVKDKLNIFIRATDIAGAGANLTIDNNNQSENDVALVQVRACLYADSEGNPVTSTDQAFANGSLGTDTTSVLYIREYGYAMGMKDSDCQVRGAFETVTSTQTDQSGTPVPNTSGTLFTYDLSTLDDGLIKIDFWAVDLVGNSGDTEVYAGTYDNGYRSIFVVKDSTPPAAATEKSKVISESGSDTNGVAAPYEWYNSTSLNKLQVKDQTGPANLIHDASNEFLRSKDNKLQWIFKVGNDPNWTPSATASGWADIHTTSNEPIVRTLADAVSSSDGPVAITMCLKDDLGNISAPVLLNSINYDNTSPVLPATTSWVKYNATTSTYSNIVATTDSAELSESGHILKIPFTEEWAGLRRIKLTVQKDGTGTAVPQGSYTLRYVPQSGTARDIDYSGNDTLKILAVDDTNPVKTGTLYISGIKIGDENGGSYRVTVDLWDSSLNHSSTYSDISIDTTPPVIEKSYIPDVKHSISITSTDISTTASDHWFIPHKWIKGPGANTSTSSVAPCYIPLYLFVKEADSGIHKISFDSSDSVKLFASAVAGTNGKTTLYKIENYGQSNEVCTEVPSSEYTIDAANKTITLVDNPTVKLSSTNTNGFVIKIDNIGFKSYSTGENTINVTVEDLATLNVSKSEITVNLSSNLTTTGVYADSYLSLTPGATLADRGTDANHLAAVTGYTNEAIINLTVTLNADSTSASACSGHNKINLSGASFINDGVNNTVVKVGDVTIPYELSADKKTITFRNKNAAGTFTDDYIVIRSSTPVEISNVLLDTSSEQNRSVTVKSYDLTGWESSSTTKSIIFDDQSPELYKGPYTTYRNESHKTQVYPHYKDGAEEENQTGIDFGGVKTFFTSTTAWSNTDTKSAGLGIRAKDNVSLYGSITAKTDSFLICYKHGSGDTALNVDKAKVIASGSFVTSTKTNGIESTWVPSGNSNTEKNSMFQICFETGTYSAVIVDKAGNCSDVFHFAIKADTTGPFMSNLQDRVLFQRPDNSSNIYRPENTVVDDIYGTGVSIRTKKYVTKQITSNYQIIFNLGATYAADPLIKKLNGTAPGEVSAYSELSATASSSPIEKYAIITDYSTWPDSDTSESTYNPVEPSAWKDFKTSNTFTADSQAGGIQSRVDGNKNLIIKLPNDRSTPIISVFLQDACGNYNYIVLGDETTSGKHTAPCFVVDNRLGAAPTENGVVTEPICLQFPFMVVDGSHISWDGVGFSFVTQSGNAESVAAARGDDGVGEIFGFMKDKVKKATYYNPAITDSDPKRQVKLGLALHYDGSYGESVTFPVTQTTKATKTEGEAGKYTLRGLLYCTQSSDRPSYDDIIDCLEAENARADNEKTGQITDWTYLQEPITNEARILLDYPRPDYDKLGWTVNETNHEPKPYYMWYLLEDRVGNYELAKVVNSQVTHASCNILYGSATSSSVFDKWLYDGKGPELTIRNTTTKPNEVGNTQTEVDQLIATNNGNIPYLDTANKRVWVSADYNVTGTGTKNTNVGWGTTHKVENGTTSNSAIAANREYMPFADLEVKNEITGIRAFCWSTSATAPDYDQHEWDCNTQGDYIPTKWYPGCRAGDLNANIGVNHSYGNSINAYFSYTESSSSYKNVYSGTKINTLIPGQLINATSDAPLYLHVMDWTGNIASYRMGSKTGENESTGLRFRNDKTAPALPLSFTPQSEPNQYYLTKYSNTDYVVRIAGKGTVAQSHSDINVEIPAITESDSGIKGIAIGNGSITNNGTIITLNWNTYSHFGESTPTSIDFYVYDNVGNVSHGVLKGIYDTTPPELSNVTVNVSSGNKMYASGDDGTSTSKTYTGSARFYENNAADPIPQEKLSTIYVNADKAVSFNVNITSDSVDDLASIEIYEWNNGWQKKASGTANTSTSYTISGTNISYSETGTIFQILATDQSGNTSCQYFKVYKDNVAPTFDVQPTVTITKGSINKDSSANKYYYTADSTHKMSVDFTISDTGIGNEIAGGKIHYYYKIGSGEWTSLDSASASLSFTNETVESIYIKDELENTISTPAKLKYVYGTGDEDFVEMEKLVFYDTAISTASTYSAKAGWSDNSFENNSCSVLASGEIRILNEYYAYLKLTFTKPAGIIGYVKDTVSTAAGAYSMADLSKEFVLSLPLKADKSDVTKSFYAVDYIGQTRKIDITFTYKNPHKAENIEFLPADSIPDALTAKLSTDGITLVPTVDVTGSYSNTRYYKNGYIVVRCTLKEPGTSSYTATPAKVELYKSDWVNDSQKLSTYSGTTLKGYNLDESVGEGDNKRYYYYMVLQLSDSHKDNILYCVVTGGDNSTSKSTVLGNYTWKQDTEKPKVKNSYYETGDSVKKLYNYSISPATTTVEDSYIGYWQGGYKSISYASGTKATFPIAAITDNSKVAEYKIVTTLQTGASGDSLSYNAVSTATPNSSSSNYVSDWQAVTINGANYEFELPDITQPHRHIALFFRDMYGNVSEAYYLGHPDHSDWQWWIVDKALEKTDVTSTSRVGDTNEFSISVPSGTIIKTLEATGGATIAGVTINGYPNEAGKNPGYNATSHKLTSYQNAEMGWIVVDDAANSTPSFTPGFKVTLNLPAASWTEDTVIKIIINGVEIDTAGKELLTISKKTFTKDNIQLGTGAMNGANFEIPVTLTDGAPVDKITSVSVTPNSVTGTWDSANSKIILSGLPDPSWDNSQSFFLTINSWEMGKVHEIAQLTLQESQFTLGTAAQNGANYEIPVTLSDGVPASAITGVSATNSVTATWDSTNNKIVLSNIPASSWDADIEIGLTVNSFNKGTVVTIAKRTLQASDIEITDPSVATLDSTASVTFKLSPVGGITITSVSADSGTISGPTEGVYTLAAAQNETIPSDVSLTIGTNHGNITKALYTGGAVQRSILAFGTPIVAGSYTEEAPESRFVQFINNVQNTFAPASEVALDNTVADKPAKKAKKATKKAKKQAKKASAKVVSTGSTTAGSGVTAEKPVMAVETAEILDQTLTSAVPEVAVATESVVSEIAGVTEKVSGESEVITTIAPAASTDTAAQGEGQTSAEADADRRSPSKSASIVLMLSILSSLSAVWYLQKNRKK